MENEDFAPNTYLQLIQSGWAESCACSTVYTILQYSVLAQLSAYRYRLDQLQGCIWRNILVFHFVSSSTLIYGSEVLIDCPCMSVPCRRNPSYFCHYGKANLPPPHDGIIFTPLILPPDQYWKTGERGGGSTFTQRIVPSPHLWRMINTQLFPKHTKHLRYVLRTLIRHNFRRQDQTQPAKSNLMIWIQGATFRFQ